MPNLSSHSVALSGQFWRSTVEQEHPLGARGEAPDGRVYRYCKAAATLVAGNCIQSAAAIPDHIATVMTAAAVGATSITFTPGGTGGAADLYAGGYLASDTTPGHGITYTVEGHAAITASTAFTLRLHPNDPIKVAIATGSRLSLIHNLYKNVIQFPVTTATGSLVGVAPYAITSGEYGWLQTRGLASVLTTGTPALGAMVMIPGSVAGSCQVVVAAGTLIVAQIVGHMAQVGQDGKTCWVRLTISD